MNDTFREDTVQISDLILAGYLYATGFELLKAEPDATHPGRVQFFFPDSERIVEAIRTFYRNGAVVEPRVFWDSTNELKQMIWRLKDAGRLNKGKGPHGQ